MKIGILTYHAVSNFGANLQALSTVGYLKKNGFDPIIINWVPIELELWTKGRVSEIQMHSHRIFCDLHLPMTNICRNDNDIKNEVKRLGIDKIFIGSDALWNYIPLSRRSSFSIRHWKRNIFSSDHDYPNPFWGCFDSSISDIPKVAFSVSSQNTPFHLVKGKLKQKMGNSLMGFDFISVRDEWTKELVEYFTDKKIIPNVTPDPVFAFNDNVSKIYTREYILDKFELKEKYILFSFLTPKIDKEWAKEFEQLCNENGFQCVGLPMPEGLISFKLNKSISLPLDTLEWYFLIKYSSGYVGERMHPIIVSLHNNIPFFSYDGYGVEKGRILKHLLPSKSDKVLKSSKTYDILQKADLLENYCSYKSMNNLPLPIDVFERLSNFNYEKCKKFNELKLLQYNEAMNLIFN